MKPDENPYRSPAKQKGGPLRESREQQPASSSYKFRARDTATWLMISLWFAVILLAVGWWAIAQIVWLIRR